MPIIHYRFRHHKLNPLTETLIIGTFNPETENNPADFFYGRRMNFLWRLLPLALGQQDLKGKTKEEKLAFIQKQKVDFTDLILEVDVETGEETNYMDDYLDKRVVKWQDVIGQIKRLKYLKRVCFTRKTFSGIPNLKKRIREVEDFCIGMKIPFTYLTTPSRIYSDQKQEEWMRFFKATVKK
jgi:G:T/U-mismatch repair DNA glycosylase